MKQRNVTSFCLMQIEFVIRVQGGRLPLRLLNLNPYPLELPRRRPLANVTPLDPIQIGGELDLELHPQGPGEVEVPVRSVQMQLEKGHNLSTQPVEGSNTTAKI